MSRKFETRQQSGTRRARADTNRGGRGRRPLVPAEEALQLGATAFEPAAEAVKEIADAAEWLAWARFPAIASVPVGSAIAIVAAIAPGAAVIDIITIVRRSAVGDWAAEIL